MHPNNGKATPSKYASKLNSFKADPLTTAERQILENYMRSLPRSAIDSHAND